MVNQEVKVRNGLKFTFAVPGTVDEYNAEAKRGDSACLSDAIDTNVYRTGLPDVWDMLAEALQKEHGIARLTKPHPNKDKAAKGETVSNETDPAYVDRVGAVLYEQDKTAGKTVPDSVDAYIVAKFQPIVETFGVVPLDLTERRGKGGAVVGKGDMDMAGQFLDAGTEKCDRALGRIAEALGGTKYVLTGEREKDQLEIAKQLKSYRAWQAEQNKKTLLG